MIKRIILATLLGASLSAVGPAAAYLPMYQLDPGMNNVVALNHIFLNDEGCQNAGEMLGHVAKREFDTKGIIPTGFVLELASGERKFINIPQLGIENLSRVDLAWIVQGLQRFTKEGNMVVAGLKACGNAPILMLDALKPR